MTTGQLTGSLSVECLTASQPDDPIVDKGIGPLHTKVLRFAEKG